MVKSSIETPFSLTSVHPANPYSIRYTLAPTAQTQQTPEDSDGEPLIPTQSPNALDEDAAQRFSATGRPIQPFKASAMTSWSGDMYSVPQFLPKQYTDDSIIPAIVTGIIPTPKDPATTGDDDGKGRRKSFVKMFKSDKDKGGDAAKKGITKVVFMPRREYIKYFAKDNDGNYCGTEPKRQWTEEELNEKFGEYQQEQGKTKVKSERSGILS